jgi:hypothetical protein
LKKRGKLAKLKKRVKCRIESQKRGSLAIVPLKNVFRSCPNFPENFPDFSGTYSHFP